MAVLLFRYWFNNILNVYYLHNLILLESMDDSDCPELKKY